VSSISSLVEHASRKRRLAPHLTQDLADRPDECRAGRSYAHIFDTSHLRRRKLAIDHGLQH
jgi:hypothetical protein